MDDDNLGPSYKPVPERQGVKTKPSKHTKKFKQMYGESTKELFKLYNKDNENNGS